MKQMKKMLALLLSAMMILSLAGCGQTTPSTEETTAGTTAAVETPAVEETPAAHVFTAPGTYIATAAGRNGEIKVTAEFSADAIVNIAIESVETGTIGVTAMDTMAAQIVAEQSLNVDMITGATMSCEAFLAALKHCVAQAGGDSAALSGEVVDEKVEYQTEADLIIVGAGAAGMTAAVTASQNGASVILLEKSGVVGGNTVCAANGINAAGSQVQDKLGVNVTVEDFIASQLNNDDAVESVVRAFCEESGSVIDWFASMGVEFTAKKPESPMLKAEADGTTAITMVNAIHRELQKTDVTLYFNMEATKLVTDANGAVTGVIATDENGEQITFSGDAVVLCTGGFGKNNELMAQYNPALANAITDEIAPTTGQGLLMALEVGANAVNLGNVQTFPCVIEDYGMVLPPKLPGGMKLDYAIYVNNTSKRFVAEAFNLNDLLLSQPDGEIFCIFNEAGYNEAMQDLHSKGFVVEADSAAALAEKLGLDAATLQATVDQYNADCAAGVDSQFGREGNLNALEGKLYGFKFGVGAHYFMGGILINEYAQVMNTEGTPITGLYAAGEVTGGLHGNFRVDGTGLGDSFVFGRIVGKTASDYAKAN